MLTDGKHLAMSQTQLQGRAHSTSVSVHTPDTHYLKREQEADWLPTTHDFKTVLPQDVLTGQ